jgi:hypothetical protein
MQRSQYRPSDDPTTTPQGEEPALVDPAAATEASEAAMIDAWFGKDIDAIMAIVAEDAIFEAKTFGDYLEGAPSRTGHATGKDRVQAPG